jgi:NAD(P)-dependent dehydrogenase (short-subunit alcohol dehydrogenase family)
VSTGLGRFEGRVALITGASRGIGLAVARRIIDEGGKVAVTGRDEASLAEAAHGLGGPPVVVPVAGRADDPDHQEDAVRRVVDTYGRIDVLVNNTAVNPAWGSVLLTQRSAMRKMVEVNVIAGLDWIARAVDAGLGADGRGAVVNVASVAGLRSATDIGFYGATKAAVMHLTQQLATELAPRVRVNAVAPAVVRTRFAGPLIEGREADVVARYPLGRVGEPEDVAAAVAYLASGDASWTTGQVLVVDGGLTQGGGI